MDDDYEIRNLLKDFNPELSSDSRFISVLIGRMEALDLEKEKKELLRRCYLRASCVALIACVILGIIVTGILCSDIIRFSALRVMDSITGCFVFIAAIALLSGTIVVNAFETALAIIKRKIFLQFASSRGLPA